jgi:MscS family membrane protein
MLLAALLMAAPAVQAQTPASTPTPAGASTPTATPASPGPPAPALTLAALEREERGFLERHLPPALRGPGPGGLRWWQWLALPLAALLALALGWLAGWLTRRVLGRLARRTETRWDDRLVERLGPPITLFWALAAASALRPVLALEGASDGALQRGLMSGFFLAAFWGAFRAIDVAFRALAEAPAARGSSGLVGLLPLLRKIAKVAALALGTVAVLGQLGFQVTSLLAGLGLGGLAVALAAQKTVENLIGSLAIGVDQPFRVGDFVQVEGTQGTVETVGMRSTRIRTLDRTLVTIPNGKLADMRIESFTARDRYRLALTLGLTYSTTAAQLRSVLRAVEAELLAHPARGPEAPLVRLAGLGASSLEVEVMAWLVAPDFDGFARARGELYLRFLEILEAAGAGLAFPTRTLHVASLPKPPAAR